MEEKFYINIGRQLGSGGKAIGKILSEKFGIPVYDKRLLMMASQQSGLCKDFFEKADEKSVRKSMFASFLDYFKAPSSYSSYYDNCISDDSLFKYQSDVIRSLAEKESCIFIGRCADYILRDNPRCVNVFISADMPDRIARVMKSMDTDSKKAAEIIASTDVKRAEYYNYYSMKEWGAASSYHLCINSSVLGEEETASFVEQFIRRKLGLPLV